MLTEQQLNQAGICVNQDGSAVIGDLTFSNANSAVSFLADLEGFLKPTGPTLDQALHDLELNMDIERRIIGLTASSGGDESYANQVINLAVQDGRIELPGYVY